MLTAQVTPSYNLTIQEALSPVCPDDGALIRVAGCSICGSDVDKLTGRKVLPGSILGHEAVGIIEKINNALTPAFQAGDRVAFSHHVPCLTCRYCVMGSQSMCAKFKSSNLNPGGFSEQVAITSGHLRHTTFKIPDHITFEEASCIEPLACVLHGKNRGERLFTALASNLQNSLQKQVAVIGLGFIGLLACQAYQQDGYQVSGLDIQPNRLALAAENAWINHAIHPAELPEAKSTLEKVDTVFLSVVNDKTAQTALELVRDGGTIVVFAGSSPETAFSAQTLYVREISIISSYSPSLNSLQQAAETVFSSRFSLSPLLTHHLPLSRIQEGISLYQTGEAIKVFISMPQFTAPPSAFNSKKSKA
jgi:L-iditol 2-dehydrogenase